jgi:1,4-alpha-glucan branching enzyme
VEYSYRAPTAKTVMLAGTFNEWSSDATPMQKTSASEWVVSLRLKPGRYLYKFVVDDKWTEDPDNPEKEDDGHGGVNSVFHIGK